MILRAAIFLVIPTITYADELGQITAFLDGEKRIWHTISMIQGGKSVATASFSQGSNHSDLYLQGHPEPRFSSKDMLSLDVRYAGQYDFDAVPVSVDILYLPNGMAGPIWTSRKAPTPARFQIVEFDFWGSAGRIVAVFSGELCPTRITSGPVDLTRCVPLSGKVTSDVAAE